MLILCFQVSELATKIDRRNVMLMALVRYAIGAPVRGQMTLFEVEEHKDVKLEVRALASCMWCGVSH